MRTILLLGVAAGSVLLAGRATSAEVPLVPVAPQTIAQQSAAMHDSRLDYQVPPPTDAHVYTGYPDRVPSEVDYRNVDGYQAQGRWTGTWNGTYETPEGQQYRGSYEGTYEGRAGTAYPPPPYAGGNGYRGGPPPQGAYQNGYDVDMERRCGNRGGTAGGAVIGGLVGGVAGNRIAGHGDRTAGTLIGAGVGALAGAAIGNASDRKRCDEYYARRSQYAQDGYYGAGGTSIHSYGGYGYGYGYYTPGFVVTTIITGEPVVTETVETTTRYETVKVPVRKRHVAKKRTWRPKPKPRCSC